MSTTLTTARTCPKCGGDHIEWSRSRGLEQLVRYLAIGYFRCVNCKSRFRRFRAWSKRQWHVVYFVASCLSFVILLWQAMKFLGGKIPGQ